MSLAQIIRHDIHNVSFVDRHVSAAGHGSLTLSLNLCSGYQAHRVQYCRVQYCTSQTVYNSELYDSLLEYLPRCLGLGLEPTMTSTAVMPLSFACCSIVVSWPKA